MQTGSAGRDSGRQPEARWNEVRILAAARRVFAEHGADAPVSLISAEAGVGMGTLYRHFPAKEDLLRAVCVESMRWATTAAEAALDDADAWRGFTRFMASCLESGVASLNHLAGSFKVNAEAAAVAERCREVIQAVADRTHQQGPLRPGITAVDITMLLRQLQLSFSADRDKNQALRTRYLEVVLSGLCGTEPLTGTAVEWREDSARWEKGNAPEPD